MFRSLVPNPERRRLIVDEAQDVTFEGDVAEQWADLARNLEAYADRRFISDDYGEELHSLQEGDAARPLASDDPPERIAGWLRSVDDEAVRDLDLALLADLPRCESDPLRLKKIVEILQANVLDAAEGGDWNAVALTVEAIQALAAGTGDRATSLLAADVLKKLGASSASDQALAELAGAAPALADTLVRVLAALGSARMPEITRRWAAEREGAFRSTLEQVVRQSGKPGREALRRLLAAEDEPAELRIAAIRLLDLTPGSEHLPALEAALSDQSDDVREEAFRALATSSSDRGCDILARGIARANTAAQSQLLAKLANLDQRRTRPVLQRLLPQVDPQTAAVPACLSIIEAVGRAGGGEAAPMLAGFIARTSWRAPLRTWRIRSAANAAIRATRTEAGR